MRLKTYIVEDNPTIRENLIGTLEELASVIVVGTAETENDGKAWLNANRQEWDLAIVDLFLKQGSGLGVLAACQDRPSRQKVVVLSNYATADIRQRCAQLGVDAVFDKSNEIDALVDYCLQQDNNFIGKNLVFRDEFLSCQDFLIPEIPKASALQETALPADRPAPGQE